MLDTVDLSDKISKEAYADCQSELRATVAQLQQKIREAGVPLVIVFEGWGGSGKGSRIAEVIADWDPRGYKVHSIQTRNDVEQRQTPMARYWQKIPEKGHIALFDRSWYRDVTVERIDDHMSKAQWQARLCDINIFERQLSDNGYILLKFFLHISKKEQKKRFDALLSHKDTRWRVSPEDSTHHKEYKKYFDAFDRVLAQTHTSYAPWNVIAATDRRFSTISIYKALINRVEDALRQKELAVNSFSTTVLPAAFKPDLKLRAVPHLNDINLLLSFCRDVYEQKRDELQDVLSDMHNRLYRKKIPVLIVCEGWDGAGKGGGIKRLAHALDPRGAEVIPIASPLPAEKNRHYLWRFWNVLPKTGHITIFDRSWYGRCLVERIEGFCSQADWQRSYQEINEFESYLHRNGCIVIKLWFQIDKDEQLRRFNERTNTPEKRWKITDEDWRNREKWDDYAFAVQDMFDRTSSDYAPWTIIEGNDKYYARIRVLETVISALEKRL